jgi:hypothetical protein
MTSKKASSKWSVAEMTSKKVSLKWSVDDDDDDDDESSDETRALLGYVPFGESPKRLSNVAAPPVSGSIKKEARFSQESLSSEVEFLGVAPAPSDYDLEELENREESGMRKAKRSKTKQKEKAAQKEFVAEEEDDEDDFEVAAEEEDDEDDFEPKKPKKKSSKLSEAEPKTKSSEVPKAEPKAKKRKPADISTEDLLDSFEYTLPLGTTRLPSLRAFRPPICNCRFFDNQVLMKAKPSAVRQMIPVVTVVNGVEKTSMRFGKPIPRAAGGSLRSWKCPGWTVSHVNGEPVFGRKEGYSSGQFCRSIVIDEILDYDVVDGVGVITEVGLSDDAYDYLMSPGARLSEKGKEVAKASFLV